jgi:APA family basic amino acid/polyamine antiporter
MNSKPQKIGLITTTSLVVGNMIGVGIFVLPAALAKYGSISLLGWVFTAIGAIILAKIFSNFSKIIVSKSGGPYAYARAGFGDFIGFFNLPCQFTFAFPPIVIVLIIPPLKANSCRLLLFE